MTSSLIWEPVVEPDMDRGLTTRLKFLLRKRYGEPVNRDFGEEDLPYLEGLVDGGIEDAVALVETIKTHGRVNVREEY